MNERLTWLLVPIAGILIFVTSEAVAQNEFDTRWNVSEGLWTENANWVFDNGDEAEPPSIDFDESAFIGNGGTAIVDSSVPDIVKLSIPNGTVLIQQGGSLKAVDSSTPDASGPSVLGSNGTLRLSGNGSLSTVDLDNNGVIELNSVDSKFNVTGDLSHRGTLALNITSAGTPKVTVGGAAVLAGTIAANFDNSHNLAFGDSFEFLSGASSVANDGARAVVPDSVVLDAGLDIQVTSTGSTASLIVGNLPVLSLNRVTGKADITNVVGGPLTLDSYRIGSERGLLNPAGWSSLNSQGNADWIVANPRPQQISELNFTSDSTLDVGSTLDLGNAYNGGATHPLDEDVTFQFSTPDGQILDGLVEYAGPANDLVLNANPETGEVTIQNLSALIDPVEVTGYDILSASGSLIGGNWTSFSATGLAGTGWIETPPQATSIAELNPSESKLFTNGTVISLGNVFDLNGVKDLRLEYTTIDEFLFGTVEYNLDGIPPPPGDCNGDGVIDITDANCTAAADINAFLSDHGFIAGDLDGDGSVAFPDFLVLSANFGAAGQYTDGDINKDDMISFPDFLILSANFGQTAATAAAVPEPGSLLGLACGALLLCTRRRRVRRTLVSRTTEAMVMKPVMTAFLIVVGMVAFPLSTLQSAEYSQTFDFPDGTDDLGDGSIIFASNTNPDGDPVAQVIGGRLQLTRDDTGSTSANFKIPSLGADATESWMASFDFEVFDTAGGNAPADGFSFNYGPIDEGANGSEEGFGVGLSIEFDTWNNGGGEAGHNIAVDGVDVPDGFNEVDVAVDGLTRRANIVWFEGAATLVVDDDIIFQALPTPGFSPEADFIFAFAARTGGATEDFFIDNLLIEAPLAGASGDFNLDGAVDLADAQILADNLGTGSTFEQGDINRDFRVNLRDFVDFKAVFNAAPGAAAVPEPSSLLLVSLGALYLLGRRRKRIR